MSAAKNLSHDYYTGAKVNAYRTNKPCGLKIPFPLRLSAVHV